jgi:hypothetical protein
MTSVLFTLQYITFLTMPVVTRSMKKIQYSGLNNNSTTSLCLSSDHVTPLAPIDILISSSHRSSSISPSHEASLSLSLTKNNFEISNSNDLEFSNCSSQCTVLPLSHSSEFFQMESECNEEGSTMKAEADPPDSSCSTENGIMKALMAISQQMMANTQDLQNQILQNHQDLQDQLIQQELKINTEIQRLTQDHETFKQQSRAALISLQSSPLPSHLPQVSIAIGSPSALVGGFPVCGHTSSSFTSPLQASPLHGLR